MNIIQWLMQRARNFGNRFAGTFGNQYKVLYSGTIVKMSYSNYKHDANPLILVLYSGIRYTHSLNLNYLGQQEKQYIGRLIYALKSGKQSIDPHVLYLLLKRDVYNSIVRKCYRTYFSNMIIQPRMVSGGWTMLDKFAYPYNDPFIVALNKYLRGEEQNGNVPVARNPHELEERIISAVNSVPVGRGTTIATRPATTGTVMATSPTVVATRGGV